MELMLNCEHPETLEKYLDLYPISGVTTNPLMVSREGNIDFFKYIKTLRAVVGERKLFAQVVSPVFEEMLVEAEMIRDAGGQDMNVKIPATETGIKAIKALSEKGFNITATVVCSSGQGIIALMAGAKYVAPFYDPMLKAGIDADAVIRQIAAYIKESGCKGKILTAGCRNFTQLGSAVEAGSHALTVDPAFLTREMVVAPSQEYLIKFKKAWDDVHGQDVKIIDLKK